jgi:hypothetical protein
MIKLIKWFFILKVWRKSKVKIVVMLALWVTLVLSNQVLSDLTSISNQENALNFFYFKWVVICFVLGASGFLFYRIYLDTLLLIGVKSAPSNEVLEVASKKNNIVLKQKLKTKSDLIIEKYQSKTARE